MEVQGCLDLESLLSIPVRASLVDPTGASLDGETLKAQLKALMESILEKKRLPAFPGDSETNSEAQNVHWLHSILGHYQITPNSLPTIESLAEWGISDMMEKARLDPNDIEIVLDGFLYSYQRYTPLCHL